MIRLALISLLLTFVGSAFCQVTFPNDFYAYRMNDKGEVCGNIHNPLTGQTDIPVIFSNDGTYIVLPLMPGTVKGSATDINNLGETIGILQYSTGIRVGVRWDAQHNVSPAMSIYNELPVAINNNGRIAYGEFVAGISDDDCTFGQIPYPNSRPCITCAGLSYILPNSPFPVQTGQNGMLVKGKSADGQTFAVQQLYGGAWRADLNGETITWKFLDSGVVMGTSRAATLDHYDIFGYKGQAGNRIGTIWHPRILLHDGHLHYGENVFLRGTTDILDSSVGDSTIGVPPLRLVSLTNGHYQTRRVVKAADMNCDGRVDNFDIDYFLGSMGYPGPKMFPEFPDPCQYTDFDGIDGTVTFFDAQIFVDELLGN
jgi:hypothetical protein